MSGSPLRIVRWHFGPGWPLKNPVSWEGLDSALTSRQRVSTHGVVCQDFFLWVDSRRTYRPTDGSLEACNSTPISLQKKSTPEGPLRLVSRRTCDGLLSRAGTCSKALSFRLEPSRRFNARRLYKRYETLSQTPSSQFRLLGHIVCARRRGLCRLLKSGMPYH